MQRFLSNGLREEILPEEGFNWHKKTRNHKIAGLEMSC
tara:strand:+ start:248 stop:361 length:114 start_codon:yes stop_codon:yes gene_type:complete